MKKLRNALVSTVILFLLMVSVSAILAVLVHSVSFMPGWASMLIGMFILLFLTMLAVEHTPEKVNVVSISRSKISENEND